MVFGTRQIDHVSCMPQTLEQRVETLGRKFPTLRKRLWLRHSHLPKSVECHKFDDGDHWSPSCVTSGKTRSWRSLGRVELRS